MKKLISIILSVALLCTTFVATATELTFTDIASLNDAQTKALRYCVDNNVIAGYEGNVFKPNDNITRAEFATIISKYMGYSLDTPCTFTDASDHWATNYIGACVSKGAISGVGDNMFEPESNILFEQAAKIITILKGYTTDEEATANGGYPTAYVACGEEKGLFANVVNNIIGKELTRIDVVCMIYNTVDQTIGSADGSTEVVVTANATPSTTDAVATEAPSSEPTVTPVPTATPKPTPTPVPDTETKEIKVGDYVQVGTIYKEPILWRCISIDDNGPLLISDQMLKYAGFDCYSYSSTSNSHARGYQMGVYRRKTGSNYWYDSNVRSWLISANVYGKVDWLCGNAAYNGYFLDGKNGYTSIAGFLNPFTDTEKAAIKTVDLPTLLDQYEYSSDMSKYGKSPLDYYTDFSNLLANYDDAYKETNSETIFLPGVKEIYAMYQNKDVLGDGYWITTPTEQACMNSSFKTTAVSSKYCNYWLRTPICNETSSDVRVMTYMGTVEYATAYNGLYGIRPCFYLNEDATQFLKGTGDGSKGSPFVVLQHNETK